MNDNVWIAKDSERLLVALERIAASLDEVEHSLAGIDEATCRIADHLADYDQHQEVVEEVRRRQAVTP